MIIYIDENLPHQLAESLNILQQALNAKNRTSHEVKSLKLEFGTGAKDEEWIPEIPNSIVITQDYNIQTTRHQRDLYEKHQIGVFFIKSTKKGLSFWEMTKLLVDRWEEILKIIRKDKTPFAYIGRVKSNFKKIED